MSNAQLHALRPLRGNRPLYRIQYEAGSILFLHVGILPFFETACPSFELAGKCMTGT